MIGYGEHMGLKLMSQKDINDSIHRWSLLGYHVTSAQKSAEEQGAAGFSSKR